MRHADFKRVKHRHMPGDLSRRGKIAMREKDRKGFPTHVSDHAASVYRKIVNLKTKAVNKRKARREIMAGEEQAMEISGYPKVVRKTISAQLVRMLTRFLGVANGERIVSLRLIDVQGATATVEITTDQEK